MKAVQLKALALVGIVSGLFSAAASAQTSTVVEFYNTNLRHYFIAADASEVTAIEGGSAGAGWIRTGETFTVWRSAATAPAGSQPVCRFYGRGPNSHFFTAVGSECTGLRNLNPTNALNNTSWYLESAAFFYVPLPTSGACASGQQVVTRYYNDRGLDKGINDANHRFVVTASVGTAMAGQGWKSEGAVFCVQPTGTVVTPPPATGTNDECLPTLAVGDTFTTRFSGTSFGVPSTPFNSPQRSLPAETFRGQSANYVTGTLDAGGNIISKSFYIDSATERRYLGTRDNNGVEVYNNPHYVLAKGLSVGQSRTYDYTEFSSADATLVQRKQGTYTFAARENVTVPAGTFSNVCKWNTVGTVKGTGGGAPIDATFTGTSWHGAGFDQIKATARTTITALGFTLDTDVLVELISGRIGTRSYP